MRGLWAQDGLPVHSFATQLDDLSGVALNCVRLERKMKAKLAVMTKPTRLQALGFELLEVNPIQNVPITMTG